jgi:hypothetical protein
VPEVTDFTSFIERANDPKPYDAAINADAQRSLDYRMFCEMWESWSKDDKYLETIRRQCENDEDFDDIDYALKITPVKKTTAVLNYAKQYSRFQLNEDVQVVENNRVLYIGQIRNIIIPLTYRDNKKRYPKSFGTLAVGMVEYFCEDEFVYTLYCETPQVQPVYRRESPRHLMPKPHTMLSQCPICEVPDKPMVDAIIGGVGKIICVNCDSILKDMFGEVYTTNILEFDKIPKLPAYDHIRRISESQ